VRLPVARSIAVLGLVSLLADVAGEIIQPLLPLYLAMLGAGALGIGAVEGAAEAAVSLVKVGSGRLADRLPRRKPLVVAGYTLAAAAKPALALAGSWPAALALRSLDRVGKGLRGAPRDAMIADLADGGRRGLAFGFHRAADTAGAVVGPLLALLLLGLLGGGPAGMRTIFLLTALPMAAAVLLLVLAVREPAALRARPAAGRAPLPRAFWAYLGVAGLFTLGSGSYVFLLLRASALGASAEQAVGLYVVFNAVYAAASIPAGRWSDRHGRAPVLAGGFALFAAASAGFALAPTLLATLPLFALYGVFTAAFETVGRAYAVDLAPPHARATALGAYHALVGGAALPGGVLAGLLWERLGPWATFTLGAAVGLACALLLAAVHHKARAAQAWPA
jgi:MFS family permease